MLCFSLIFLSRKYQCIVSATLYYYIASATLYHCIASATVYYCIASATLYLCIASATLYHCIASATLSQFIALPNCICQCCTIALVCNIVPMSWLWKLYLPTLYRCIVVANCIFQQYRYITCATYCICQHIHNVGYKSHFPIFCRTLVVKIWDDTL